MGFTQLLVLWILPALIILLAVWAYASPQGRSDDGRS